MTRNTTPLHTAPPQTPHRCRYIPLQIQLMTKITTADLATEVPQDLPPTARDLILKVSPIIIIVVVVVVVMELLLLLLLLLELLLLLAVAAAAVAVVRAPPACRFPSHPRPLLPLSPPAPRP